MHTIEIKGLAGKVREVLGCVSVTIPNSQADMVDGITCEDDFSEYLVDCDNVAHLKNIIIGGIMKFSFDENEQALYVIVKYQSKELLSQQDLDLLIDYTQGQLSDGIGEGFEQYPFSEDQEETEEGVYETISYYVSPWFRGQVLTATQK